MKQLYWIAKNGVILAGPFTGAEAKMIHGSEKMTLQASHPHGKPRDVAFWPGDGRGWIFFGL